MNKKEWEAFAYRYKDVMGAAESVAVQRFKNDPIVGVFVHGSVFVAGRGLSRSNKTGVDVVVDYHDANNVKKQIVYTIPPEELKLDS